VIEGGNAAYCPADHAIYYDRKFMAEAQTKVAAALGTDGDYAPIAVLAHELGHRVSFKLLASAETFVRIRFRVNQTAREALADCLAGAATGNALNRGLLDRYDLEEGLSILDQVSEHVYPRSLTGVDLGDLKTSGRGYPSAARRIERFRAGFRNGAASCGGVAAQLGGSR
jgi:predicted metalloprotease